jgi:urea transport system substrate-binding protein
MAATGALLPATAAARPAEMVEVGILHSLTGIMAFSESTLRDAEVLALEEINAAGGVLGRKIESVVEDTESKLMTGFSDKAQKLVLKDKVAAVFGCWTSVSRKNVIPIVEDNNGLLFFPVDYEGNETSKNVVYGGTVPSQQAIPAIDWLLSDAGGKRKKVYLVGSEYMFPRTVNLVATRHLKTKDLTPVAQKLIPLGHTDFTELVADIKAKAPDVLLNAIQGQGLVHLFDALAATGLTADKLPVMSLSFNEDELRFLNAAKVKGHFVAASYFQSVDTPANARFVKAFKNKYGKDRVTFDYIEAAYTLVHLWAQACAKAKSFEIEKVREALRGLEFDAPGGKVKMDAKNQHLWKPFRVGRIRDDGQFDVVYQSAKPLAPEPYRYLKKEEK